MKPAQTESPAKSPTDCPVPLASVLCTEELNGRPTRPPDYGTENGALVSLASTLAESPLTILQALTDKILEVTRAGSAGLSLLTKDDGGKSFYWPAISGMWKVYIGGGTPRDFGPCGDVLDSNTPLLFRRPERRYTYFLPVTPPVEEALLVPFYAGGRAVGTIWAVAHDDRHKFDGEDRRQLVSLGRFASSAYKVAALSANLTRRLRASKPGVTRGAGPGEAARLWGSRRQIRPRPGLSGWTQDLKAHALPPGVPDRERISVVSTKHSRVRVRSEAGDEWDLVRWQVDCGAEYLSPCSEWISESDPAIRAIIRCCLWEKLGAVRHPRTRRRLASEVRYLIWILERNGEDVTEFREPLADLESES